MVESTRMKALTVLLAALAWLASARGQGSAELLPAGEPGKAPEAWAVPTQGWVAEWASEADTMVVRLRPKGDAQSAFGNLMRSIDATPYRGRRVTLEAMVRVESPSGHAQMWLRVDRPNQQIGAFDNMGDRPIRPGPWSSARIELDVEPDAERLALGIMSLGGASVLITGVTLTPGAEVRVQAPSAPAPLSERGLQNLVAAARALALVRFFHPSDEAVAVRSWDHVAVALMERAEPARNADELAAAIRDVLKPLAPGVVIRTGGDDIAPIDLPVPEDAAELRHWRHIGAGTISSRAGPSIYSSAVVKTPADRLDERLRVTRVINQNLGGGVWIAAPRLVPADADGTLPRADLPNPWTDVDRLERLNNANRATRFAAVATVWGVMQHFYPYFDVPPYDGSAMDWDGALRDALRSAATDASDSETERTLQRMVARLYDGHGSVLGPGRRFGDMLPFALVWAGNELVVSGKAPGAPDAVAVGDAIVSINGRPMAEWEREASAEVSGATRGWVRHIVASRVPMMAFEALGSPDPAIVELRKPDGARYTTNVPSVDAQQVDQPVFKRPANGAELAPGIRYFDLNATENAALTAAMPVLAKADGIVFDMRGYPGSAAYKLMEHLIDGPATSAQWNVPIVTLPGGEGWEWSTGGRWQLKPARPRLTAQIAFVTDGRAISYAESIMGIVEAYRLGEIVGSTTAGTNGNVNPFTVAGGHTISWTGMKVLKHDGSRHHGVGIAPTVPVEPTPAGIAAGRDEVLERAVEGLKAKIARD